jgi:tetratricopeptide (TPR) repeat protein
MKAEERHRLAENDLVKGMNQLASTGWRPSRMMLIMAGLVVVLGFVYWYWSTTAANRVSKAWVQYYEQRDRLEDAPASWKSGPAGQAVQLGIADKAFERGFSKLFLDPAAALKDFENAGKLYEDLSKSATTQEIQLRSIVGAARSYENTGDVTKALGFYDQALAKFSTDEWKEHPLVKDAKEHKEKLSATGDASLAALYQTWSNKLRQVNTEGSGDKPAIPSIPMPPMPK